MPRCIYCATEKPLAEFNREHVIHAAFGGFEEALTLVAPLDPGVCAACNSAFGKSVDLVITRDSMEAVLRVNVGLKSPTEVADLFRRRVRFRLPPDNELGLGPLVLEMVPTEDGTDYQMAPVAQVRFRRVNGGFKAWPEGVLAEQDPRLDPDIDLGGKLALFWPSYDDGAEHRLRALLARYEIPFLPGSRFDAPPEQELDYDTLAITDVFAARAVAKIAFNYLAKTTGASDREFVHGADFDAIRAFIRFGTGRGRDFVQVWDLPKSTVGLKERGALDRHTLQLQWEKGPDQPILCLVRLFGVIAYVVRLAPAPEAHWRKLVAAHEYDLAQHQVRPLPLP